MQTLRTDNRQAGVRISQDQHGIRLHLRHQFIRFGNDIPNRFSQIRTYGVQIIVRSTKSQIIKEYLVQCIIVILSSVNQNLIEVLVTSLYHRCQTDDFRTGTDDGH